MMAYTAAFHSFHSFHVADLKYRKGEKYRALRQVGKERRLVKLYEFLISPRMSTRDLSRLIALVRVIPRFLGRVRQDTSDTYKRTEISGE